MTQFTTNITNSTSAISLGAITAGAVAAALVVMSIGSIITIISLGASINTGLQTASNFTNDNVASRYAAVIPMQMETHSHYHKAKKHINQNEKNFYIDAILREDSHSITPSKTEQTDQQPKLSIKGNHVFASLNSEEIPQHDALVS